MARSEGTRWTRPSGLLPAPHRGGDIAVEASRYVRRGVLPFDHERQLASVLVEDPTGTCSWSPRAHPRWSSTAATSVPDGARSALEALFSEGARVVAVATRPAEGMTSLTAADEQGLELGGLLDVRRPAESRCR